MAEQATDTPRVLFLLSYFVEGNHAIKIGRALRRRGWDVFLARYLRVTGNYREDSVDDFRSENAVLDLVDISPREYRTQVQTFVVEHNVNVIVQVGFEPIYMALPLIKSSLSCVKICDLLYNDAGHIVSHFMFEGCFDVTIVESRYMYHFIRDSSDITDPVVAVAESGVEIDKFHSYKINAPPRPLTLGYVGRMSPEKNPLGFVQIADEIAKRVAGPIFRMFGSGPQATEVVNAIERSGARDRIFFHGYVDDIGTAMSQIDVLFVPSLLDGRPTTIMEANASGVPVVGSPIGGIPEMIREGENGYICSVGDIQRQAELIQFWANNPGEFDQLRRKSRSFAEEHFSHERMVDRYMQILARQ